jgi:AraC-like DNA-binding protein
MARRIGLSGAIRFTPSRVGLTLHVPCERGRHVVDVDADPGSHPDMIAKRMIRRGWTVGSKLTCPDCSRKPARRKEPAVVAKPLEQSAAAVTSMPTATGALAAPSEAAKKAHRFVMMMLEEHYDEAKNCYRAGYSDAKIAKESGASEPHVRDTREKYFGPIGEPAEVRALKAELAKLSDEFATQIATFQRRLDEAGNRLASVCKAHGWPIPA